MDAVATPKRSLIPWIFVAGFGVVAAVNGTMMSLAIGSFSGLYTAQARQRGVHYNDVIAEQARRDALGWKIETSWNPDGRTLEVAARMASGEPLPAASASIELVRPAERRAPLPAALVAREPGRWIATLDLPAYGVWDVDVVVSSGGDRYATTRRMFLK
jgi:nitrogen fixation protein FixH